MTQANETFDTNGAAKTGSVPTFLVAMEQYEPPAQRIIEDDLAANILPGGERFFLKLLRIPLLRNWMINLTEKQIKGCSSAFLCRKQYIDETIVAAAENGSVDAIINLGEVLNDHGYAGDKKTFFIWEAVADGAIFDGNGRFPKIPIPSPSPHRQPTHLHLRPQR